MLPMQSGMPGSADANVTQFHRDWSPKMQNSTTAEVEVLFGDAEKQRFFQNNKERISISLSLSLSLPLSGMNCRPSPQRSHLAKHPPHRRVYVPP
jgi:hypothetical protein